LNLSHLNDITIHKQEAGTVANSEFVLYVSASIRRFCLGL